MNQRLRRFLLWTIGRTPRVIAPVAVPVARTEPQSSEPCCFAKGIARSLVTERAKWRIASLSRRYSDHAEQLLRIEHSDTGFILSAGARYTDSGRDTLAGCDVFGWILVTPIQPYPFPTEADSCLIARTIEANPLGQWKESLDEEAAKCAREAKAVNHFVKLGCPPS